MAKKYCHVSEHEKEILERKEQGYSIWLERRGVHHNPKTILRFMNKYSLLSVVRRRRYCNYSQALHRYENLLNRDFHADRPNRKRVIDDYIHFYNHQRIQLNTKLTPLELRSQFSA